ncbi:response regulator [Paludisphaera soli]|uniref:response regulator n=1 Tax=Paludisphaera soli TaxID=2712865 RepID=UPI0013EDA656|nr:response regulator [Paludisphaera soli]
MRVLLVEDMDDLRESSAWLLQYAGCEVLASPSGTDALSRLEGFTPELVLTDFMMPQMDGIELIRRLGSMQGLDRVPKVMVTADSRQDVERLAREAGATDVVIKPADVLDLLARYGSGEFRVE